MTVHAKYKTKEYAIWQRIKNYCKNPNVPPYQKYGARGIRVCQEWETSFSNFMRDVGPMPADCNGFQLLDENADFCKVNFRWALKKVGRPAKEKPAKEIRKGRDPKDLRKRFKEPQSICLVMEKDHLDFIKNQALQRSLQEGEYVEPNELIREALAKAFPTPKMFDMFGQKTAR